MQCPRRRVHRGHCVRSKTREAVVFSIVVDGESGRTSGTMM
jgi:hypothetical protein